MSGGKSDRWLRVPRSMLEAGLLGPAIGNLLVEQPATGLGVALPLVLFFVWVRFVGSSVLGRDGNVMLGFITVCVAPPAYSLWFGPALPAWFWISDSLLFALLVVDTIRGGGPSIAEWFRGALPPETNGKPQ
jgi:hypothetical protein